MSADIANVEAFKAMCEAIVNIGVTVVVLSIKITEVGSWYDDLVSLADKIGSSADAILAINPQLLTGNYIQDDHGYSMISIPLPLTPTPSFKGTGNAKGV